MEEEFGYSLEGERISILGPVPAKKAVDQTANDARWVGGIRRNVQVEIVRFLVGGEGDVRRCEENVEVEESRV